MRKWLMGFFLIDDAVNRLESVLISVPELKVADNCHNNSNRTETLSGIASVLLPLVKKDDEWHILLTLRAKKMRHHGGEVAFPGGMWESGDNNLVDTALRECEEEVAIPSHAISVLGGLPFSHTRRLTRVRPVVGIIHSLEGMMANPAEIAEIFTVPLTFFMGDSRIRTDIFTQKDKGLTHRVPAYDYQGYEIWGFTASVIVQLINLGFTDVAGNTVILS
jgi:8-oxo-dGTP pyrophosphatase MutT (NUDIX family)